MSINAMWFFAIMSLSGIFAVTFSVVLAYVADVTIPEERSNAYGMVSATFAASLITSPAVGAYLAKEYNEVLVVALASAISVLDLFFILVAVPESLSEKVRTVSWGKPISWEKADPFAALRKIGQDHVVMLVCGTVFLSYLPEAGQYSSFFLYLKQIIGFSSEDVAVFIAVVGILSVFAQSVLLSFLIRLLGNKKTILCGLVFQMMQLSWFAVARERWMIWCAGCLAALSSIIYPAISGLVSANAEPDQQGVVQGIVTGVRGLCSGLGPAMFGFSFYLFHIDLKDENSLDVALPAQSYVLQNPNFISNKPVPGIPSGENKNDASNDSNSSNNLDYTIPGPAFAIGAVLVVFSLFLATLIPENFEHSKISVGSPSLLPKGSKCSRKTAKTSPMLSEDDDDDDNNGYIIAGGTSQTTSELSVPLIKATSCDDPESLIHSA